MNPEQANKKRKLHTFFTPKKDGPMDPDWTISDLDEQLLLWIISSGVGYSGVENPYFRKIQEYFISRLPKDHNPLRLHKADYYRRKLDTKYDMLQDKLKTYLGVSSQSFDGMDLNDFT